MPDQHSRPPEMFNVGGMAFLGEQDGIPERDLKDRLRDLFQRTKSVLAAYLAIVRYDSQSSYSVALCLLVDGNPNPSLVEEIGKIFSSMFGAHEHLDMIFLENESQRAALSEVCRPFYAAG